MKPIFALIIILVAFMVVGRIDYEAEVATEQIRSGQK